MLSHIQILNASPKDRDYQISEKGGLSVLIRPSGVKLFRARYTLSGTQFRLTLGRFPELSLADARRQCAAAIEAARQGCDPKTVDLTVGRPDTFADVSKDWHGANDRGWSQGHSRRVWRRIELELLPDLGGFPITDITEAQLLATLRKLEARGVYDTAKRCRQYADAIFAYAIAEGRCERNPAPAIRRAMSKSPKTQHMAFLREADLPGFFERLRAYDGRRSTKLAIELVLHTFVRTSEILGATVDELEGDTWRIPGKRMKNGLEHLVPLSSTSKHLFEELVKESGRPASGRICNMSSNTMIFALYRMGYHSRATIHGFRSTASTALNESGLWRSDAIERQLSHVEANQVRGAYNAAMYLPERRQMMTWWSQRLHQFETEFDDPLGRLLA